MLGAITDRDVFRHAATIVCRFGPAAYARCVRAVVTGRPGTFLEAIQPVGRGSGLSRGRLWRTLALSGILVAAGTGVLLARNSNASDCACDSYCSTA